MASYLIYTNPFKKPGKLETEQTSKAWMPQIRRPRSLSIAKEMADELLETTSAERVQVFRDSANGAGRLVYEASR